MKCPYCGSNDYETWEEEIYENEDDPTPEYGGKLINTNYEVVE